MTTTPWHVQMLYWHQGIPQDTTTRYSLQLTDDAGTPLTLTQITTVVFTIFDLDAHPPVVLIGPRDVKNVPANGGLVSSSGLLTVTCSPVDNALLDPAHAYELRRWTIDWTHTTGTKAQYAAIDRLLIQTT